MPGQGRVGQGRSVIPDSQNERHTDIRTDKQAATHTQTPHARTHTHMYVGRQKVRKKESEIDLYLSVTNAATLSQLHHSKVIGIHGEAKS